MSAATEQQLAPTEGQGDAVWPLLFDSTALVLPDWFRADMRERHELGVSRYGVPLRVWNGRDAVVDAYQEALDLAVYTQQARCRLGAYSLTHRGSGTGDLKARQALDAAIHAALSAALRLGELARAGTVPTHPPLAGTR